MLAPPGYAKIVSTPSRSRQATRISLPDIVGPSSPRFSAGAVFVSACVVLLIIIFAFMASVPRVDNKKTHDRLPAVGSYRNPSLTSTSAYGAANYDDDQQSNLSNNA